MTYIERNDLVDMTNSCLRRIDYESNKVSGGPDAVYILFNHFNNTEKVNGQDIDPIARRLVDILRKSDTCEDFSPHYLLKPFELVIDFVTRSCYKDRPECDKRLDAILGLLEKASEHGARFVYFTLEQLKLFTTPSSNPNYSNDAIKGYGEALIENFSDIDLKKLPLTDSCFHMPIYTVGGYENQIAVVPIVSGHIKADSKQRTQGEDFSYMSISRNYDCLYRSLRENLLNPKIHGLIHDLITTSRSQYNFKPDVICDTLGRVYCLSKSPISIENFERDLNAVIQQSKRAVQLGLDYTQIAKAYYVDLENDVSLKTTEEVLKYGDAVIDAAKSAKDLYGIEERDFFYLNWDVCKAIVGHAKPDERLELFTRIEETPVIALRLLAESEKPNYEDSKGFLNFHRGPDEMYFKVTEAVTNSHIEEACLELVRLNQRICSISNAHARDHCLNGSHDTATLQYDDGPGKFINTCAKLEIHFEGTLSEVAQTVFHMFHGAMNMGLYPPALVERGEMDFEKLQKLNRPVSRVELVTFFSDAIIAASRNVEGAGYIVKTQIPSALTLLGLDRF